MKNFNKNMQRVFKGVIKPKAFFILLSLFFSSLAFAASLSVTWLDGRIPSHNSSFCKNSAGEYLLNKDSTEDPYDVVFSTDGLQVFSVNFNQSSAHSGYGNMNMNRLSRPFDMTSVISDQLTTPGKPSLNCDDIDSFKIGNLAGASNNRLRNIVVADGGSKFFISNNVGRIMRFDLSTPNEFKTNTFVQSIVTHTEMHGFAFSDDGTKLITIRYTANTPLVTTYQLPSPYDISSITQIHQVDITDIGVTLPTGGGNNLGRDIEFSKSGHAMFVLIQYSVATPEDKSDIYQFTLGKKFDVSTATLVGNYDVNNFQNQVATSFQGYPIGFTFSSDGMRMFIVDIAGNRFNGIDQINSYQLECPYGLVACVSDPTASIGSQVELSKQNINLNISTIFKRFEWIKRNRDQEDLTSHNINLNYPNPLLEALAMNLEPTAKKTIAKLVGTSQKKEKKSKWSSWSLGDLTISNLDKLGLEKAKNIRTEGLTIGADRKFGDNKFFGWAIRYGNSHNAIQNSQHNTNMDSLTLNIYGIIPRSNNQYINSVIGISALRFDNKYLGKLSGERNGKQAFVSFNYRTKNAYGRFNVTPSGKFTYGVTKLSDFTDFISKTIDASARDVRYKDDTFRSGELAGGFLFEMDKIESDDGTFQPMGSIEYVFDLTPHNDFKFIHQGSTEVNKDTIIGKYSRNSLKTIVGFEAIHLNGLTLSASYETLKSISRKSKDRYTERYIIKISRSKEKDNSEYALNFNSLRNNSAELSYAKQLGNLNLRLNSGFDFKNNINYLTNFEISGIF